MAERYGKESDREINKQAVKLSWLENACSCSFFGRTF